MNSENFQISNNNMDLNNFAQDSLNPSNSENNIEDMRFMVYLVFISLKSFTPYSVER